jgi:DNA-binding transcriptional LysR family regulator
MRMEWMRVFQEVIRRGSITEASRTLGYTQSAVSRHVAALEAEYGVRLLERGPGGVEPTPYGVRLLQHADAVLAHDALLRRELDGLARGVLGHVTVGAFPTAVAGLIPAAFTALRESRPDTTVSLIEATTPALLERIHAGDLDVAVVTEGPDDAPAPTRTSCCARTGSPTSSRGRRWSWPTGSGSSPASRPASASPWSPNWSPAPCPPAS